MTRVALVLVALAACTPRDTGDTAETGVDSGHTGETAETGLDTGETGETDTGDSLPLDGFGTIDGTCGTLATAIDTSAPALIRTSIDFATKTYSATLLTDDGQEVIADGNLGGSSLESEAIAMEILVRCELAELLATESEIAYVDPGGKKTDLFIEVDATGVGVSVTRAYHFPPDDPYTVSEAEALLTDKLGDVLLSAANADPQNAWTRSALAVLAYDAQYADQVVTAWGNLDASVQDATIVLLTETHGEDGFIY